MTMRNAFWFFMALVLGGCVAKAPQWEAQFGESFNTTKAQQTINPEASLITEPVEGIDGRPATAAVDNYYKSFVAPPDPVNVFSIDVGGTRQ